MVSFGKGFGSLEFEGALTVWKISKMKLSWFSLFLLGSNVGVGASVIPRQGTEPCAEVGAAAKAYRASNPGCMFFTPCIATQILQEGRKTGRKQRQARTNADFSAI